ncbi:MAG: hypothetical protein ABIK07_13085 [Planctomycetota bacterium]
MEWLSEKRARKVLWVIVLGIPASETSVKSRKYQVLPDFRDEIPEKQLLYFEIFNTKRLWL